MASSETEMKTYMARCHCNATQFTVTIPPLETGATKVNQCNCSICTKSGYMLVYPLRENVKFLKGEQQLKAYFFGRKVYPHRFCGECGTSILIDFINLPKDKGGLKLGVSARTFDGIEDLMDVIKWTSYDGKTNLPLYEPWAEEKVEEKAGAKAEE